MLVVPLLVRMMLKRLTLVRFATPRLLSEMTYCVQVPAVRAEGKGTVVPLLDPYCT